MSTGTIGMIGLVVVPVRDQDRAVEFYVAIGFTVRDEWPWADGHRWIELAAPQGPTAITLVPGPAGGPTGLVLTADDVDAVHTRFAAAGLDVDPVVAHPGDATVVRIGSVDVAGPTPAMFWLRDPDGNALLVVQGSPPTSEEIR